MFLPHVRQFSNTTEKKKALHSNQYGINRNVANYRVISCQDIREWNYALSASEFVIGNRITRCGYLISFLMACVVLVFSCLFIQNCRTQGVLKAPGGAVTQVYGAFKHVGHWASCLAGDASRPARVQIPAETDDFPTSLAAGMAGYAQYIDTLNEYCR